MERLEEFCESPFWDFETIWNTTNPDFPECFQKTVLVWIPCGFLWLFAPLEMRWLATSTRRRIPWTGLNILKLVIGILLIILTVAEIGYSIGEYANGQSVPLVDYYTPFIKFVTLLLATLFIFLERRKGMPATGVTFIFWLLMAVCGVIGYRSILMKAMDEITIVDEFTFVTQMIVYPLVIGEVILNSLSDAMPQEKKTINPCPDLYASFVSKVTFSWFGGMAFKGYRSPLEKKDLWSLNSDNECGHVFDKFNSHWKKDLRKAHSGQHTSQARFLASDEDVTFTGRIPPSFKPSILIALCKTFGANFILGSLFKLINDLLVFVNPLILQLLIDFASGNDPAWRGYLYVVLIFAAAILQFVFLGQYFYIVFLIGLRVRSAVISAIYRKALRLSNSSKKTSTVGEIVNLMSVDAQRLMDLNMHLNLVWSAPLQIALAMYFLWNSLGASAFAGLAVLILLIPINGVLASKIKKLQMQQMKKKDQRIKMMNEVLNGIKVLKLNAWEESFYEKINFIRSQELLVLKKSVYLSAFTAFIFICAPFLVMMATFTTYVLISDTNILTASKAFVSLSLFNILRAPMNMLPNLIVSIIQAAVSLKRINKYMAKEEINPTNVSHESKDVPLSIDSGTFSWGPDDDPVLSNVNLSVPKGSLVAVVGPVGAGKSSLLSALLGEMDKLRGNVNTIGTIAYVPQQAWIQNTSLKNNIIFANALDDDRYASVIDGCALQADLEILPGGDETEIGEKGINLSGGQKQRVSLARAVYANLDNYLLDDPLSAVDSHVGKHIFNKIIGPDGLLRKKTRILVTHGITYLSKVDLIVVLKNGIVSEIGTYKELLDKKGAFAEFLMTYLSEGDNDENIEELQELKEELIAKMGSEVEGQLSRQLSRALSNSSCKSQKSHSEDRPKSPSRQLSLEKDVTKVDGIIAGMKLVTKETTETGKVAMSVYRYYINSIGLWLALVTVIFNVAAQGCAVGSNIWLSYWSNDEQNPDGTQDTELRDLRLGVYGTLGFLQSVGIFIGMVFLATGTVRASSMLHAKMCYNVLRSPMSFFDTTPLGRIVNRFARDVDVMDNTLFMIIRMWLNLFLQAIATLVVISISTPIFLVTILPIGTIFYFIQKFYISTSRQLKRLESVSRSPIYSHFSETVTGAMTIRAYNRQREFIRQSDTKVDENQICYYPSIIANRWLAFRLELVGSLVVTSAALFAVLGRDTLNPGVVGLSLSYALSVTTALIWMVRMSSELETNIVAVERVKEYTETPQEAAWCIQDPKPPSSWPEEGYVTFSDYKTRYREGLDNVLHGFSCSIKSSEKVGIAGRTGAGKSSLTLALFRIIEPVAGNIVIDGVDVTKIGLHDLRAKLTIIPQDPVLFSGTLRMNLDPFNRHTDEQLWQSLENSHLKTFVCTLQMGLEHEIAEGGENLSVGQRQLVCLARALLRKTKVLVLDEATAAVDLETDDLIQATIRKEFADCTIITIAHRLNTIMDNDRIMVLDRGRIREFAAPSILLKNKESLFYSMAKDAGLI